MGAIAIGGTAGVACFFATSWMKRSLRIDDSLDVTPVHGVGGIIGTLLTGVFAQRRSAASVIRRNGSMGGQVHHATDRRSSR
jgi:Amt family ammonium transporter